MIGGLLLLPVAIAGCGEDDPSGSGDVSVAAGTTQVADLARNVAGERAEVAGILTANSDPHDYEPRPSDAEAIADADLVLQSGGDLDLWLEELVESSGSEATVLSLLDAVETIEDDHDHGHGEEHSSEEAPDQVDPHWWQDPANAIAAVEAIRDELIGIDPEGSDEYEANADAYIAELEALDSEIAACMERIPAESRKLVTSHDALGYFADAYEIEIAGAAIPALTTQAQPSAGETAELVELIRDQDVAAIFPEAGVSTDLEQAIAEEADAEVGGALWADALGPEGSDGETYVEAMAANAEKIAAGFSAGERQCAIAAG